MTTIKKMPIFPVKYIMKADTIQPISFNTHLKLVKKSINKYETAYNK